MVAITSPAFKRSAREALGNAGLQKALAFSKPQFMVRRTRAVEALPEFERLRDIGKDIKDHALANLDFYLETYADNVERAGDSEPAGHGGGSVARQPGGGRV